MEKFRLAPMNRMDLVRLDQSASPAAPMRYMLQMDTRTGELGIGYYHQCDNAVTMDIWHGLTLEWSIPNAVDAEQLVEDINAGELDALLTRIVDGYEVVWDGNNHIGRGTEDAGDASEEVQQWLYNAAFLPDGGGLQDASDWFCNGPGDVPALTATTTDAELEALAETLEQDALSDYVVLHGTVSCLRQFREELQEEIPGSLAEALYTYTGDNRWNDVVLSARFRPFVDEDATEAADPSGASDIVVLRDGTQVCYYEADGEWRIRRE